MTQQRAHALLSASGADRWLACTPSARLEDTLPDTDSEFSREGTLAHAVAECELARWLGHTTADDYNASCATFRADKRVTPDFLSAVKIYVDYAKALITEVRATNPDAVVMLEQKFDFSHIVPEGFGTGDLVVVGDRVLHVVDLKFGKGLPVSAVDNSQEKLYGAGAVEEFSLLYDFDTVRLHIVQPRLDEEPSVWDIKVEDLIKWATEVVAPRAKVAWAGEGDYVAGDHCGFCRAKGSCRARAEANLAMAQFEFKDAALLTPEEIAEILLQVDGWRKWATDIKTYALEQAERGAQFPGWKLVHGRSNRQYRDQAKVAQTLIGAGIPEAVIYEKSLLGITAMEKAITKKVFAELLTGLIDKPPGKPTLVQSSDPRSEVEAGSGFDEM